ncbi:MULTISPECIES: hypothetical protein [unclassified Spirosoma]|uniref:hypothetical protein n=1 Tax=unclassified Spirosoma TaxID=2621999 RepID=UPI00095B900D|nr:MULTISPECIES: hypothetical protein [unclassified Spirosoma]MBN8825599.1 hypothetical protein [Spirosoma sp.]OJW71696.1 MAG: hypothetical protein BGO59_27415 [Spirosoma sp. 48-14]
MNIIWRIAGVALAVGLALFLLTLILKVLLVGAGLFLVARFVGPRLAGRAFGPLERGRWQSANVISIDDPAYRSRAIYPTYSRVIPIG